MKKICCMCKNSLPVENFKKNSKKSDGLQSQCIECQKTYRRQHYVNNRQKYIDKAGNTKKQFMVWWFEFKKQFSCTDCGESHPACIQFHHHNDDKEANVASLVKDNCKIKVLQEIEKCTPLCANCHFKRHWQERLLKT